MMYVLSLMLQHVSISEGHLEGRRYKIRIYIYVHSCVQNCGLCTKINIMHVAFSGNMKKNQNYIIFNVK